MNALDWAKLNSFSLKLTQVPISELGVLSVALEDIFVYEDGLFTPVIKSQDIISVEKIKDLQTLGHQNIFIGPADFEQIQTRMAKALAKVTRSLSMGDPIENGKRQLSLLSHNMRNLYKDPLNQELLTLQFQSALTLSKFLIENKKVHHGLYKDTENKDLHFTLKDPLLSSLMLMGYLQYTHLFHPKEMELLFISSYLKDLGYSFLDQEIVDKGEWDEDEGQMMLKHAGHSKDILAGRTPLNRSQLQIIEQHHFLDKQVQALLRGDKIEAENVEILQGSETLMVAVMDLIVNMGRLDRSLYTSLDLIKIVMADKYPSEFRALIFFLKNFFSKHNP